LNQNHSLVWFNFYSKEAPSIRYRATYLLDHLKEFHGITFEHLTPSKNKRVILRFLWLILCLLTTKKQNIVVIQRVSAFGWYSRTLKLLVKKTRNKHCFFYDLDDAIYEEMADDSQIRWFMEQVHQVVVGSEELRQYALKFNPNSHIITTAVVPTKRMTTISSDSLFTIGFIGCFWGTHYQNMRDFVMPALCKVDFPVVLEIIGAEKPLERQLTRDYFQNTNVTVVFKHIQNWFDESEINTAMCHWQLGLAPLHDTVVCRAKSAFKVKQYLNLGIPAVSTRIGENQVFIQDKENGFLFDDSDQLAELITYYGSLSTEERIVFSKSAKASSQPFQLEKVAKQWMNLIASQQQ